MTPDASSSLPQPAPSGDSPRPFYGILAMDPNRVIGKDGYLPWKLKEDLKWFRRTTTGNTIVMGRTTWEGILAANGANFVFPKRHVVVLTRQGGSWPGAQAVVSSMAELTSRARAGEFPGKVIIGGGAQVFAEALPYIETMYVTRVHTAYEGDVWMPEFESGFPFVQEAERHADCTMLVMSRSRIAE